MNMETGIYMSVKIICAVYVLYRFRLFVFGQRVLGFWTLLYRWARIIRLQIRRLQRKRLAAKAKRDKKKEASERIAVTDCDVIGKTKTVHIEDPLKARREPVRSEPLPESDFIGEDNEISSDDVYDNLDAVSDIAEDELLELMEPPLCEPDPDFSRSMTYEDIQNMADVLSGEASDESKRVRAAEILRDIQDTDFSEFLVREAANREKIEALMREYFDDDGNPRKKRASEANVAKDFDWSLYV